MSRRHEDPIVDPIRKIREEISAEFGHDPDRLIEYLMEYQKQFKDRLVSHSAPEETEGKSAA